MRSLIPRRWRRDESLPPFSGWRIVGLCAVLSLMTAPGQTTGVSVFIDPMIEGLGLSRSEVSSAYLIGTLTGAFALPTIGRLLDRRGPRFAATVVGSLFGAVLVGMAGVVGLITLTLGFTGIRMLGQGGLSVVASTTPARWFNRRRGLAIGITTAIGSAGQSIVPLATTAVILAVGWRLTWATFAVLVWVIVLSIARWGLIDRPEDVGQRMDGEVPSQPVGNPGTNPGGAEDQHVAQDTGWYEASFTKAEAMRTPIFWAVTMSLATAGLITTALTFHQISILGEQGLSPIEAAVNFVPQTITALTLTLVVGSLIDRVRQRFLLVTMMALLAASMVGINVVEPGLLAIIYGIVLGASQGMLRSVSGASYPKLFGVAHAGEIRGFAQSVSIAASAFGPLALSFGFDLTASYRQILLVLLILPAASTVFALLAPEVRRPPRSAHGDA